MENEQEMSQVDTFASWEVPEYNYYQRDFRWYVIAIGIAFVLVILSFLTQNFLLPVIIIIVAFIFIMQHGQKPDKVLVSLNNEGVVVGNKFYEYDEFRNFGIVYKPNQGDKNLYFEFKSAIRPRLSMPLEDMNPVEVRNYLLGFLKEDLERTDIPLSESLAKIFKL